MTNEFEVLPFTNFPDFAERFKKARKDMDDYEMAKLVWRNLDLAYSDGFSSGIAFKENHSINNPNILKVI